MGVHLWSGRLYIYAGSKDWTDGIVAKLSKKKRKSKRRKVKQKNKKIEVPKKKTVKNNKSVEKLSPPKREETPICTTCKRLMDKKCSVTGQEPKFRLRCLFFMPNNKHIIKI